MSVSCPALDGARKFVVERGLGAESCIQGYDKAERRNPSGKGLYCRRPSGGWVIMEGGCRATLGRRVPFLFSYSQDSLPEELREVIKGHESVLLCGNVPTLNADVRSSGYFFCLPDKKQDGKFKSMDAVGFMGKDGTVYTGEKLAAFFKHCVYLKMQADREKAAAEKNKSTGLTGTVREGGCLPGCSPKRKRGRPRKARQGVNATEDKSQEGSHLEDLSPDNTDTTSCSFYQVSMADKLMSPSDSDHTDGDYSPTLNCHGFDLGHWESSYQDYEDGDLSQGLSFQDLGLEHLEPFSYQEDDNGEFFPFFFGN